jgi:hypothetical protein
MKIHGDKNEPDEQRRLLNLNSKSQSTNQSVLIPWLCGEEKLPCLWIGRVSDQYTKKAPQKRPAKK